MPPHVAEALVSALLLYLLVGLALAIPFVARGVQRIDPSAQGAGLGFRLAILPGCTALWPWVLRRWLKGSPPPEERNSHRRLASAGEQS